MQYELGENFSFIHADVRIENDGDRVVRLPRKEKKRLKKTIHNTYKDIARQIGYFIPRKAPIVHYIPV